jgi:hypothetical protein
MTYSYGNMTLREIVAAARVTTPARRAVYLAYLYGLRDAVRAMVIINRQNTEPVDKPL